MPHRRNSGAKARSHKLGFNNNKFQNTKQARLNARKILAAFHRLGDDALIPLSLT